MSTIPALEKYPFTIASLSEGEGGGFAITFPDLPGCLSDGATIQHALADSRAAFQAWMNSMIEDRKPIPIPYGRP